MDTALQNFVAGLVSGVAGVVAGQPLDTLRIRYQQRGNTSTTVRELWRNMASAEGSKAVFKGMSYPLVTSAVQTAVTFHEYERVLRLRQAAGGLWAGAVQTLVVTPVDVLKIRLQLQEANRGSAGYVGPLSMLRSILLKEGLPGLFRGFTITLIRDTPSYAVYFCTYHWCCELSRRLGSMPLQAQIAAAEMSAAAAAGGAPTVAPQLACLADTCEAGPTTASSSNWSGAMVPFFAGGAAGITSWFAVYPFDVIKSRMQAVPRSQSPYRHWLHCATLSLKEEGPAVFVRGLGTTLSRAFLVNASIFATYQLCMEALIEANPKTAT